MSGYDEKKICSCIMCGVDVEVTKFATASKVKCDKCKGGKSSRPSTRTAEYASEDNGLTPDQKICQCIKCKKPVIVTKFATPDKVLCVECKKQHVHIRDIFDLSKGVASSNYSFEVLGAMANAFIIPEIISDVSLRTVICPKCGRALDIIKIVDSSLYGIVVNYQCSGCKLLVGVSTQTKKLIRPLREHEIITYNGEQIHELISATQGTRVSNALQYLYGICKDNNIEIPPMSDLPPITNVDIHNEYGITFADIDLMRKLLTLYKEGKIKIEEEEAECKAEV